MPTTSLQTKSEKCHSGLHTFKECCVMASPPPRKESKMTKTDKADMSCARVKQYTASVSFESFILSDITTHKFSLSARTSSSVIEIPFLVIVFQHYLYMILPFCINSQCSLNPRSEICSPGRLYLMRMSQAS